MNRARRYTKVASQYRAQPRRIQHCARTYDTPRRQLGQLLRQHNHNIKRVCNNYQLYMLWVHICHNTRDNIRHNGHIFFQQVCTRLARLLVCTGGNYYNIAATNTAIVIYGCYFYIV